MDTIGRERGVGVRGIASSSTASSSRPPRPESVSPTRMVAFASASNVAEDEDAEADEVGEAAPAPVMRSQTRLSDRGDVVAPIVSRAEKSDRDLSREEVEGARIARRSVDPARERVDTAVGSERVGGRRRRTECEGAGDVDRAFAPRQVDC